VFISRNKIFLLIFVCFCGLVSSCSNKKNTFASRAYHNLTSRFNGFFYSKASFAEGVEIIEKTHLDRYDRVLPVFKYGDPNTAKSIYPQMDKTFKKSSAVIERHSILIKNIEYVKWIDENYLLIGKSHFYKRDYFAALEVFDYVSKQYKKQPTRFEARLWMARIYNELGIFDKAQSVIDLIKDDKKFPKEYQGELDAIEGDFYIKQELYSQAIPFITKAIAQNNKKRFKARLTYILAQLHQKTGEPSKSARLYSKVIKMNPEYEMAFNAKINLATSTEITAKNSKEVKKLLNKMLKDDKNIEYFDQIYYALAEVNLKTRDTISAVNALVQSTKVSSINSDQKGRSFLKLGDIYFDRPNYRLAQAYYDSSVTFLNKDYPGYDLIVAKKKNLTNLVNNLNVISYEDSLQRIARMSETERDAYIESIIAKAVEEENKKKEQDEAVLANPQLNQNQTNQSLGGAGSGSTWYFYNPSTLSFGYTEFLKKWGNRKLEDNWRRSNKQSFTQVNLEEDEDSVALAQKGVVKSMVNKDKNFYKKSLPLTVEQLKKSEDRIIEAYYNAGLIYKEQLQNNIKSVENYEELLKRYPENKYKLPVYYQLYRLYTAINNSNKAEYYKNILLTKHAETEYAKIIQNPEYVKQTMASKNKIEDFYEETYDLYLRERYQEVITKAENAQSQFPKNFLMPKFDMLKALSIGKTRSKPEFQAALQGVIAKYPADPVKIQAELILQAMTNQASGLTDTVKTEEKIFEYNPDDEHFVAIFFPVTHDANSLKIKISDFNAGFFSTLPLEIANIIFNDNQSIITIKGFDSKNKAMDYYNAIKDDQTVFGSGPVKRTIVAITQSNFNKLFEKKNLDVYKAFFVKNYQNQQNQ